MFLAAALYSSLPEGLRLTRLTWEPTLSSISSRLPYIQVIHINRLSKIATLDIKLLTRQRGRLASLLQPTLPTRVWQSAMVERPHVLADTGMEMLIILITSSAFPPSLEKSMNDLALLESHPKHLLTQGHRDTLGPRGHHNQQSAWLSQGERASRSRALEFNAVQKS